MDVYLAGSWCGNKGHALKEIKGAEAERIDVPILESFYYADEWTEWAIPRLSKFLLDSGAFTFLTSCKGKRIDWDEYLQRFAAFIVKNGVERYFELDIDPIIGYDNVLKMRAKLEALTNRPCIPVWHVSRGKAEFLKMCDEYDYVAIGGIVSKEIKPNQYGVLPWFINEAHKRGAKIHGLGFTNLKWLPKCRFDSVDSTSWTAGNRFGHVCMFDGRTVKQIKKPEGARMADARQLAIHNFNEWVKFQKYARSNL